WSYGDLRLRLGSYGFTGRQGTDVRVIAKSRLRQFWESWKEDSRIAEADLSTWYKLAREVDWPHFGALRQTFGSADQVGNCVVFDVGNNRYRLIGRVNYTRGIIYVLRVMDHREYDKKRWINSCGCNSPPPRRSATAKGPSGGGATSSRPKGG